MFRNPDSAAARALARLAAGAFITLLLAAAWARLAQGSTHSLPLAFEVHAQVPRAGGQFAELPLSDGGALRSGDRIQLRFRTERDAYIYVIALGSSGNAVVLRPFGAGAAPVLARGGELLHFPAPGEYVPLDGRTGRETLFAFASERPVADLAALTVRMEAAASDLAEVTRAVTALYPDARRVSFRHLGAVPLAGVAPVVPFAVPSPASAASGAGTIDVGPGPVLTPPGGGINVNAPGPQDAQTEAFRQVLQGLPQGLPGAAPGAGPGWLDQAYRDQGVLSGEGSRIPALPGGPARNPDRVPADAGVPRPASRPAPEPQSRLAPSLPSRREAEAPGIGSRLAGWLGFGGADPATPREAAPPPAAARTFALPSAPVTAPPDPARAAGDQPMPPGNAASRLVLIPGRDGAGERGSVLLLPSDAPLPSETVPALAPAPANEARGAPGTIATPSRAAPAPGSGERPPPPPGAALDLSSESGVGASLVLVVTPLGAVPGVIIDPSGLVLTTWHVLSEESEARVLLKAPGRAAATLDRAVRGRVVGQSRFADLALLRLDGPPPGLAALRVAGTTPVAGAPLHAVIQPEQGRWVPVAARLERAGPGIWYSGDRLLHRGEVVEARLDSGPQRGGALLFDAAHALVGLGSHWDPHTAQLTAISAQAMRDFLATHAAR